MAKNKKKDEKDVFKSVIVTIMIITGLACFGSIISTQATLAEKREELHELEMKTEEMKSQNEEYQRLFNADDINSYKEKLAIENMNYAYPNEIRFYDTSRN
jgi:cell division protein FtsL